VSPCDSKDAISVKSTHKHVRPTIFCVFNVHLKSYCLMQWQRVGVSRKYSATENYYQRLHNNCCYQVNFMASSQRNNIF